MAGRAFQLRKTQHSSLKNNILFFESREEICENVKMEPGSPPYGGLTDGHCVKLIAGTTFIVDAREIVENIPCRNHTMYYMVWPVSQVL